MKRRETRRQGESRLSIEETWTLVEVAPHHVRVRVEPSMEGRPENPYVLTIGRGAGAAPRGRRGGSVETLEAGGRKLACEVFTEEGAGERHREWRSPEVPGHVARRESTMAGSGFETRVVMEIVAFEARGK